MIVRPKAHRARTLIDGFVYAEGVRWHDDSIWLSDITGHRVVRCWLDGRSEVVVDFAKSEDTLPALWPSGLGFLPDGRLLIAMMNESGSRRAQVLASLGDGSVEVFADASALVGGRLNDMVVSPDGEAWIGAFDEGAIVHVSPEGEATVALRDVRLPNGLAISADGATLLFVANGAYVFASEILDHGALGPPRLWADLTLEAAMRRHLVSGAVGPVRWEDLHSVGGADGIALDDDGGLWIGAAGGEKFLRMSEGGFVTDIVATPGRFAIACALGGSDGKTLVMTTAELGQGGIRTGGIGSPSLVAHFLAGHTTSSIEVSEL